MGKMSRNATTSALRSTTKLLGLVLSTSDSSSLGTLAVSCAREVDDDQSAGTGHGYALTMAQKGHASSA
jgi:hypothetical protein